MWEYDTNFSGYIAPTTAYPPATFEDPSGGNFERALRIALTNNYSRQVLTRGLIRCAPVRIRPQRPLPPRFTNGGTFVGRPPKSAHNAHVYSSSIKGALSGAPPKSAPNANFYFTISHAKNSQLTLTVPSLSH